MVWTSSVSSPIVAQIHPARGHFLVVMAESIDYIVTARARSDAMPPVIFRSKESLACPMIPPITPQTRPR